MNIGIVGSGVVARSLGSGFVALGHHVKAGSRDPSKLSDWKTSLGSRASTGDVTEAAAFGEVVVLATSWTGTASAIKLAGEKNFAGKVLIDVTNPLDFSAGAPPKLATLPGNSGGEQVQGWLPDARVVKAFNTIGASLMCRPHRDEGDPDLFIAGNDAGAKELTSTFARQWGWKSIIDMGNISEAYWLEALAMVWIRYGFRNNSWAHAFKLLRK